MSDTVEVVVNRGDGWKSVITGLAGAFSASGSCRYFISETSPDETVTGHRLNAGDVEMIGLGENETLYVKNERQVTVIFSDSGVGYQPNWFQLMSQGLKAQVSQSYTEVNSKTGSQWSFSAYIPSLASGTGVSYLLLTTGDKPIALKARTYSFDGLGVQVSVYRDPVVTGSDDVTGLVSNLNDRNPETLLSTLATVTEAQVTSEGVLWVSPRVFLGYSDQGNRVRTTVENDLTGLERWFAENSTYLFKTETIDPSDNQRFTQFATFYEGFPDLPVSKGDNITPEENAPVNISQASFTPQPPSNGDTVTADEGDWNSESPITYEYQWQLDDVDIVGATSKTLLILVGMVGQSLKCVVKATNSIGFSISTTVSVVAVL